MARSRFLLFSHLALIAGATLAAYLDLIPHGIFQYRYADKAAHFLLFGFLSFLLRGWMGWRMAIFVPLLGAGIEELAQSASPHRTCDIWDYAADVAGVLFFQAVASGRFR